MDLSDWIEARVRIEPAHPAIVFEGRTITYGALLGRIEAMARALAFHYGIRPGDRVAHLGYNTPETLILVFACARLGALTTPLNWRLARPELAAIMADCTPSLLLHDGAHRDVAGALGLRNACLDQLPDATGADSRSGGVGWETPTLLVYTSGTTGRPKGAMLSQSALYWNAVHAEAMHAMSAADRILTTLPLFHVGGLNIQTLPALRLGATVHLHRRFSAQATFEAFRRDRPTLTVLVPAQMRALTEHAEWPEAETGSLRLVATGSSSVPDTLVQRFHDRGVPVSNVYGATETAPIAVYLRSEEATRHVGSCGAPAEHCHLRIVDESGRDVTPGDAGELWLRGPNLMAGYWNDPAATDAAMRDGWFRTGDIGVRDADGFVRILERKKDVIISGGENVYPAELELILADMAELSEACVVAAPHPRWGEVPVIVGVCRPTAAPATADQSALAHSILARFEGRVARFKQPKRVVFLDALPRNAMGKVLRHELRALLAAAGDGAGHGVPVTAAMSG